MSSEESKVARAVQIVEIMLWRRVEGLRTLVSAECSAGIREDISNQAGS